MSAQCSNPQYDGVDLNRNFAKFWKGSDRCDDIYGGGSPFSEPETMAVKNYLLNRIKPGDSQYPHMDIQRAAIDVHSYSQVILIPEDMPKRDKNIVERIGKAMRNAINGETYPVKTVSQFFDFESCRGSGSGFRANGTAMDWFYYGAGAK